MLPLGRPAEMQFLGHCEEHTQLLNFRSVNITEASIIRQLISIGRPVIAGGIVKTNPYERGPMTLLSSSAAPLAPGAAHDDQPAHARQDAFGREASGPLAVVVIAELSRVLAGPYCTMILADMGATVIKVESPSGDETRAWKPPVFDGQSPYYLSINRN